MSIIILLHHYQDEIDFNTVQINPLDQSGDAIMTRHSIKMCWVVEPLRPQDFTLSGDMSQASIGQWIYLPQGPQEISWSLRIHNPIHFNSLRGPSEIQDFQSYQFFQKKKPTHNALNDLVALIRKFNLKIRKTL